MKDVLTIDWEMLGNISYQTQLGKTLRNTLRKFNKEELFDEINDIITHYIECDSMIKHDHRIKSIQSCALKYEKYFPSTEVEKVFNDILGIRIIVDDYSILSKIAEQDNVRMVDLRHGKSKDDGYRAVHAYYQKNHYHYPIEIQFMTPHDHQFNEWLHIYLYKYLTDKTVGCQLRTMYDNGEITNEEEFRKEMQRLCAT